MIACSDQFQLCFVFLRVPILFFFFRYYYYCYFFCLLARTRDRVTIDVSGCCLTSQLYIRAEVLTHGHIFIA